MPLQISLIFGSIFCVLGTEFFKNRDDHNFGTFARTFYTLWIAMAFGVWENKLPFIDEQTGSVDMGVLSYTMFFVVFMLWISLQVRTSGHRVPCGVYVVSMISLQVRLA